MDKNALQQIKAVIAAIIGALTAFWGWFGWLVMGWILCMLLDYLTGSMAAAKEGQWSSAQAREGIWHKCGMIVVVIVAAGADMLLAVVLANLPLVTMPFAYSGLVCPVVLVWYIVTELGSMAENAVAMGARVPGWLPKMLAVSRDAVDNAAEKIAGEDNHLTEIREPCDAFKAPLPPKTPDTCRQIDLAGQTVRQQTRSGDYDVTYDAQGYCVKAIRAPEVEK